MLVQVNTLARVVPNAPPKVKETNQWPNRDQRQQVVALAAELPKCPEADKYTEEKSRQP
jgi:hypothetical protein